jgi:hypothetical protein
LNWIFFPQDYQKYTDDGTLAPGWHSGRSFILAGSKRHASAINLQSLIPPGSVLNALHKNNPDRYIWHDFQQWYFWCYFWRGISTFEENHGICAIPSMCVFTVKHTYGIPTHAKSRIVVLGNLEQPHWNKSDYFSPVVSIPMIHLLTALAVHNGRTLKQSDCKFAFIQATPYHLKSWL